ncbi:Transmembrane protein 70 homolog, mitochondrial [Eumeta japonica]|uniref:Transmembrane protein 70 homolog, mitochondrial n=1 Tax=Eumeta variegata TaxID=151549 RepID=A0A4C1XQ53_EUMVA|nr:Transmembrane protein 70 homolog, mitochondrial [Eumeta japonica]
MEKRNKYNYRRNNTNVRRTGSRAGIVIGNGTGIEIESCIGVENNHDQTLGRSERPCNGCFICGYCVRTSAPQRWPGEGRESLTTVVSDTTLSDTKAFNMLSELRFKPEDVDVPDVPGMFTTFNAKGKSLFVDARHFPDPNHYAKIMGYDKPIDFKMEENVNESKPE